MLRVLVLCGVCACGGAALYSGFWAPLFNPRLLHYRVDAAFTADAGRAAQTDYERAHGYRGQRLVAALGAGNPPDHTNYNQVYGPVSFYYTYRGANTGP